MRRFALFGYVAFAFVVVQGCGRGDGSSAVPQLATTVLPVTSQPTADVPKSPVTPIKFITVLGRPPGGRARVTVQSTPKASCGIRYIHPSGKPSTVAGLDPTKAGADGTVSWGWVISTGTSKGTGTVIVTCGSQTISSPIDIK